MGRGYGEPDVTIYCDIYGCGAANVVPSGTKASEIVCEACSCPLWPMELGFTGNVREHVMEFARTHDRNGNPLSSKRSGE
jgi:hypothetical protein